MRCDIAGCAEEAVASTAIGFGREQAPTDAWGRHPNMWWSLWLCATHEFLPPVEAYLDGRLAVRWREREPLRALGPAYTLLENKYFLDDIYLKGIVRPIQYKLSAGADWFNQNVLDGIVHSFAWTAKALSKAVEVFDRRGIDGAVNGVAQTAGFVGGILRYVQSGNVQRYAAYLFAGVILLAIVFTRI